MEFVRRKPVRVAIALAAATLTASALGGCSGGDRGRLVVRTDLPDGLREAVEASFEERHPDIDLHFSEAVVEATFEELTAGDADFDVWWGVPARALLRAEASGVLASNSAIWAPRGDGASEDGSADTDPRWHPWLTTPLVVAFDRTVVSISDAPSDWIDVFHHAWFEEVRVPDPASTQEGATLVGAIVVEALRDDDDLNRGFDWLARLHDQVDAYVTDSGAAVDALRRGDALLAVMSRAEAEAARRSGRDWLHYRIPTSGTPELVMGVAVVEGSPSSEAAQTFVDHLGSDQVATAAKLHTHWEPVAGQVDGASLPPDFELPQSWRAFDQTFDTLAVELDGWLDRWEREVRTR
ncbi:MAG: extracellular solute-binding protein [Gemmatimonadetes bacterium]|nr:extracellular solute-binding protein [Gemmatimonadota bacterium]